MVSGSCFSQHSILIISFNHFLESLFHVSSSHLEWLPTRTPGLTAPPAHPPSFFIRSSMPFTTLPSHPVGVQEMLSCSKSVSLSLCIFSPGARYTAEQRPLGFQAPGLDITQESVPEMSAELGRVVQGSQEEAATAALWWLRRSQSCSPSHLGRCASPRRTEPIRSTG